MRININYVLDSAFAKECIFLNQQICKTISKCEIDFSTKEYRPHITLFMGEVDDNNFEFVFKKVTQIVSRLKFSATEKQIKFKKPFFKDNYIMCDVVDAAPFKKDCQLLIDKLQGLVTPHRFSINNGTASPHITLGYCKESFLPKGFIQNLPHLSPTVVHSVACSRAGKHGTVLIEREQFIK